MSLALGSNSVPASVRVTCRAIRSNSLLPIFDSSRAMRLLMVDCVTSSKNAASENELVSATLINALKFWLSIVTTVDLNSKMESYSFIL